jgi:plasmid stabilization system protein ParE
LTWFGQCFNEVGRHYNPNDFDSRLAPQAKYSAQDLAENPNIGLYREGLGSSCNYYQIFYRPYSYGIRDIRVVHQRMDSERDLS